MRIRHTAALTVAGAALALPAVFAATAQAAAPAPTVAPAVRTCNKPPGPWTLHTSALNIRSKASTSGVILGILYKGQAFTVNSYTSGETWVNITDRATGVRGWVSGQYLYRIYYTCLT